MRGGIILRDTSTTRANHAPPALYRQSPIRQHPHLAALRPLSSLPPARLAHRRATTPRRNRRGRPAKTPLPHHPPPGCASPPLPTAPSLKTGDKPSPCKPTAACRPTPGLPTANCCGRPTVRKPCGNRRATATTPLTSATRTATTPASTSACKPRRNAPPRPCACNQHIKHLPRLHTHERSKCM